MKKEKRLCSTCLTSMDSWYIYDWETYCCDTCLPISVSESKKILIDILNNLLTN